MTAGLALICSTALLLSAFAGTTVSSQSLGGTPQAGTATARFLTPLPSRFVIQPGETGYPRSLCPTPPADRCPRVLTYGATGGLPTIEPAFKSLLPHVRVTFVLQEIFNDRIVDPLELASFDATIQFATTSVAASVENGDFEIGGFEDGPKAEETLYLSAVIYDALVFNACDSFSTFPVEHDATIIDGIGSHGPWKFHGSDSSTLNSTGYYDFHYVIRVSKFALAASDFHFSGKVIVTCTGLTTL